MNFVEKVSQAILRGCTSVKEVHQACEGLTRRQVIRAIQNAIKNGFVVSVVAGGAGGNTAVYGPGPVPLVVRSAPKAKPWIDPDLRGDLHWIGRIASVWELGQLGAR